MSSGSSTFLKGWLLGLEMKTQSSPKNQIRSTLCVWLTFPAFLLRIPPPLRSPAARSPWLINVMPTRKKCHLEDQIRCVGVRLLRLRAHCCFLLRVHMQDILFVWSGRCFRALTISLHTPTCSIWTLGFIWRINILVDFVSFTQMIVTVFVNMIWKRCILFVWLMRQLHSCYGNSCHKSPPD